MKEFDIKRFDCVFSNPPYNKNADLKILKEIKNLYNYAIIVHPAGYLFDKKFKNNIYNEIRNTNHLEKIITFWGNNIFNISLFTPCCISIWNNFNEFENVTVVDNAITKSTYSCNINNISVHGEKTFNELKTKLNNHINMYGSLISNITPHKNLTDFSVRFQRFAGRSNGEKSFWGDFFTLLMKDKDKHKCDHAFNKHKLCWTFNSEKERENFLNYCTTKFVRFILSLRKSNAHLDSGELDLIPWLDFSQEWNDKKLVEYFGITKEEWEYINKFIPDYYDDYVSGF